MARRLGGLLAALIVGSVVVSAGPASAAPPANDNFVDAVMISGLNGSTVGTNVDATGEPGEPGQSPLDTVWYRWTPPAAGQVTFDTCGPELTFDTRLAAYTGIAVNALTLQAENDDSCDFGSLITFTVTAGTEYRIQVQGFAAASGTFPLNWLLTPSDVTDPTVEITTPADGAEYVRDEVVTAEYSCVDEVGGSGIDTCAGPVPDGAPVDTTTVGDQVFEVTATDLAGNTTTVSHTYTVVESPPDDPDDPDEPVPAPGPVLGRPPFAG